MVCRRCIVQGRVQGVFFRASTQSEARTLGLTGHALNRDDGGVEVLICGREDKVAMLQKWLERGPAAAQVESVSCAPAACQPPAAFTTGRA